jgi:hypothetical protein
MFARAPSVMDGSYSSQRWPARRDSTSSFTSRRLTNSRNAVKAHEMSAPPESDSLYTARIHKHFRLRCGKSAVLTIDDWKCIQQWREAGLPLECVIVGIDRAFEQNAAPVTSLLHCVWSVREVCVEMHLSQAQ